MPTDRSPNYPALGLSEAVERLQRIWDREGRSPVDPKMAVKHMGYRGLSGPARSRLAALKKYGLLAERDGMTAISDLGVRVLRPQDEEDRQGALQEAFARVPLFVELAQSHRDASDENIKGFLIQRGFTERGSGAAVAAFRNTLDCVDFVAAAAGPSSDQPVDNDVIDVPASALSPPPQNVAVFPIRDRAEVRISIHGALSRADARNIAGFVESVTSQWIDEAHPALPAPDAAN